MLQIQALQHEMEVSVGSMNPLHLSSHRANTHTAIALFLTAVAVAAVVLLISRWLAYEPVVGFCETPDCRKHAEELKAAMDRSADPCTDFYKFACGSWKAVGKEKSVIARVFTSSAAMAMREMEADPQLSVVPMAPQYYQSCIGARIDMDSELEIFKKFKRDLGLDWPEKVQNAVVDPLTLLLNLSINWNFHVFFNLRAMPVYRKRSQTLYMRRGLLTPKWQDLSEPRRWMANVREHCRLLKAKLPDSAYAELEAVVKDLMNASISVPRDATNDTTFALNEIEHFIQPASNWWRDQLNELHGPQFSWTLYSPVALEDATILLKLDRLVKNYAEKRASLLTGLAWVFVRQNLWMIARKPELVLKLDPAALEMAMKRACLNYVQSYFGLLISARHIYERYNSTVRAALQQFYDFIKEELKQQFRRSEWIEETVKTKAIAKLDELSFNAMPEDRFFSKIDLNQLYRKFPRIRGQFVENFIAISKAYRQVIGEDSFISIFSKRLGGGDASRYNYYYNIAFVALGAMEPPILYGDGTPSMQYGSLGPMLAQCMVRSFDGRGAFVSKAGDNEAWWGASEEYHKRVNCDFLHGQGGPTGGPGSRRQSALFPLATGLAVVYAAYRSEVASQYQIKYAVDELRLRGLEDFSEDQLFFLTYCLSTCAANSSGDACNVPLQHSINFAAAFQCEVNSRMNPSNKCLFFE
ncbi:neprilysin-like [Dermacentor andersoni]|uniref:neprilysin-like n=1 Tax=Dermacentor andersoni TaxID=34620 RepID=UPI003B3B700C